jgi:hypothetical protein
MKYFTKFSKIRLSRIKFTLSNPKRRLLADKLMDTSNYAAAAMVFALAANRNFDTIIIMAGILFYLTFMIVGIIIRP